MIWLLVFCAGFLACAIIDALEPRRKRFGWRPSLDPNPGETIMAISADVQAILDRLNAVPAQIETHTQNAVAAAEAAAAQNHADDVAALTAATDAVVNAAS